MTLRGLHLLPVTMFIGTFAWAFVYVSLPFHIRAISTLDAPATLRWTGWILGISCLVTVVTAPMWGGATPSAAIPARSTWSWRHCRDWDFSAWRWPGRSPSWAWTPARRWRSATWARSGGPVLATTVLAWTSAELLYVLLGVVGLACVPLVRVRMSRAAL